MNYHGRFHYICDESFFERYGPAVAWRGADGLASRPATDRFVTEYYRRSPIDGKLYADDVLAASGLQALSLQDAVVLGFTTTEYQACIRRQMLESELIQNEEQLLTECSAPRDYAEAMQRECGLDTFEDWVALDAVKRVPYPDETWFSHERAIGWADPQGLLLKGLPANRFDQRWLVRDVTTGELLLTLATIREVGLESLSLSSATKLGFSTVEYRTALRVRLYERRHIIDETDLAESIQVPVDVQNAFQYWGRIFIEPEDNQRIRDLYGSSGFNFRHEEELIRLWMDRHRKESSSSFTPR